MHMQMILSGGAVITWWSGSCLRWIWVILSLILEKLSSPRCTEESEVLGTLQIEGRKRKLGQNLTQKPPGMQGWQSENPTAARGEQSFAFSLKKFKIHTVFKMKKHKSDSSLFTHCFCFLPRAGIGCINTS